MEATTRHILPKEKKRPNTFRIILVAVASILIFAKCGNDSPKSGRQLINKLGDTTLTLCKIRLAPSFNPVDEYMVKVVKDSLKMIEVDTVKGQVIEKKGIVLDSFYIHIVSQKMTTKDGKDSLDSRGLPIIQEQRVFYPKELCVYDYNYDPRNFIPQPINNKK